MINFLKKIFKTNRKIEPETIQDYILGMNIGILGDGKIEVHFQWKSNDIRLAKLTGEFLSLLNQGLYEEHFIEIIKNYGTYNLESQIFAETILNTWKQNMVKKDAPLISPSNVLKISGLNQ